MRIDAGEIQGLTPSLDPRRSNKTFIIEGKNFVMDVKGPKSAFGNAFLSPETFPNLDHLQGFRLRLRSGDRCFTFFPTGIAEWDEVAGGWVLLQETLDTTIQPYRWTGGYLNGYMFFCHPAAGIYAYHVELGVCRKLDATGLPSNPIALLVSNGRVCIIDEEYFFWSASGDGLDYVPRLGGPGFQKINDRVSGFPIMITSYPGGVFTWTTGGVMRSEFTGDAAVWRHRVVNTEYRPVNSFCTLQMDANSMVILDERGLFVSKGDVPQPLTPIFNEFLIQYMLDNHIKFGQNCRLEFDDLQRRIYLSLSLSRYSSVYERAFVLYPSLEAWGSLDEPHYGIVPLLIEQTQREGDYFGFAAFDKTIRLWTEGGGREISPVDATLDFIKPAVEKPVIQKADDTDVTIFSSWVQLETANPKDKSLVGFYPKDGATLSTLPQLGLDSFVRIGLIRAIDNAKVDQLIEIDEIFIGSAKSGSPEQLTLDFNLVPDGVSDEDYNLESGEENYGFGSSHYINHGLRLIGTIDGRTLWTMEEPLLVRFDEEGRYYSCSVTGLWTIVEISADTQGEYYHIKALELNGIDAGKLN